MSNTSPLTLDKSRRKIAGVCAGLARHLDVDVTLVRVMYVLFSFFVGCGVLIYVALWLILPAGATDRDEAEKPKRERKKRTDHESNYQR